MALDIGHKRIGVALAAHSSENNIIYPGNPIEYPASSSSRAKGALMTHDLITKEVNKIIHDNKVCAFVVNWPVQKNGRLGKSCGRVLHVLDHFTEVSKPLVSPIRPFTLWEEGEGPDPSGDVDKWGRSAIFSQVPSAHQKMYNSAMSANDMNDEGDSTVASYMLQDFMNSQYAQGNEDMYHIEDGNEKRDTTYVDRICSTFSKQFLDDYESNGAYVQSSVL